MVNARGVVLFIGEGAVVVGRSESVGHFLVEVVHGEEVFVVIEIQTYFPFLVAGRFQVVVRGVDDVGHYV